LLLGTGLLGEKPTAGLIAGPILIAVGAWLATGRQPGGAKAPAADSDHR
jgi:hypothetical protein